MALRFPPSQEGASIILIGSFNPRIITPNWLVLNRLIRKREADAMEVEVVHRDFCRFGSDQYTIETLGERFAIVADKPPFDEIRDLVARIFGEKLVHTPINAMGINRSVHFQVPEAKRLTTIGEKLAPKEPWGEWGKRIKSPNIELFSTDQKKHVKEMSGRAGGMRSIAMEESYRPDGIPGHIRAKVEPSQKVSPGVFVEVNNHFDFSEEEALGASAVIMRLQEQWEPSIEFSDQVVDQIMSL